MVCVYIYRRIKRSPEGFKRITDIKRSARKEEKRRVEKPSSEVWSKPLAICSLEDEEKLLECGLG